MKISPCCLCVMVLSALLLLTVAAAGVSGNVGISVTDGVLPQSRQVDELPRVGHWAHGENKKSDAAFFRAEDAVYESWLLQRREMLQRPGGSDIDNAGGTAGAAGDLHGAAYNTTGGADSATDYFSAAKARVRRAAIEKALNDNSSLSTEEQIAAVVGQVAGLADAVVAVSMERKTTGIVGDAYSPLVEHCYSHVVRRATIDGKLTSPLSSWFGGVQPFIPSPFVASTRVIKAATRETSRLQAALDTAQQRLAGETDGLAAGHLKAAEAQLHAVQSVLEGSTHALRSIFALSKPLYLDGIEAASHELLTLRKRIVDNDEATEALRKQMKHLVKSRNRLQSWENELRAALRYVRRANTVDQIDTKEFSTETMAAVGLALFASQRLGCSGHFPALEALPPPSLVTAFTGLRTADFGLEKRPVHHALLFFAFAALALREVKVWVLDGALRTAPPRASGQRTLSHRLYRRLFQLCAVSLTLLPVVWVLGEVARLQVSGGARLAPLFAFISPRQKRGLVLAVVLAMVIARLLVALFCLCPSFLEDPVRKRRKKTA